MKIFNDVNRFTIDWTLNSLCTYHCSYCPPGLHQGVNVIKNKNEDPVIIKNFLSKIKSQVPGRSVHVFINGGEPTISPSLDTILDFCHDSGWCAYVNTNGSRSMEWWQQYAHKIYKVTISYHPESVVDEEIFEKVKYISTQTNVGVFTLMFPPYWEKSKRAYETFRSMDRVTIAPSRVFKRKELENDISYEYTEEQLEWLKINSDVIYKDNDFPPPENNAFGNSYIEANNEISKLDEVEFANNRKNTFVGWNCNMGLDHILIRPTGDILHSACKQAHVISNIFNFESLPTTSTVCKTEWCMCTADILIPKHK